jgi:hypothetical protein
MNVTLPSQTEIIRATEADLPAISKLAGVIWRACYPVIISHKQIDYMLARIPWSRTSAAGMSWTITSWRRNCQRLIAHNRLQNFGAIQPCRASGSSTLSSGHRCFTATGQPSSCQ